jgi:hypothetical protein
MPGVSGVTVTTCVLATLTFARKTAGASGARHSLRPLIFRRRHCLAKLGRIVPRERGSVSFQLFENRIGNGVRAHTPSTSSWRRPRPIRRGAHVERRWSTAFVQQPRSGVMGPGFPPGRHRLCSFRIRTRVGKGASAPCPPSIGSLILNGGHASLLPTLRAVTPAVITREGG